MFIFPALLLYTGACLASTAQTPTLEGWQFGDTSRSSWDLLWSCLSTIFACTWTILCLNVERGKPDKWTRLWHSGLAWLICLLCPELTAWSAVEEYFRARQLATYYNALQLHEQGIPSQQTLDTRKSQPSLQPNREIWTTRKGFCVNMGGLAVQTRDSYRFTVSRKNIQMFLSAGLLKSSDFDDEDVKDLAKVDALGKLFTVGQSAWIVCNIIARKACSLSISPLELATVAYVVLGLLIAAFWWKKPKDVVAPIIIPLYCTRDELPFEIRQQMELRPGQGIQLRPDTLAKDNAVALPRKVAPKSSKRILPYFILYDPERIPEATEDDLSPNARAWNALFGTALVVVFGGIHTAGYASPFLSAHITKGAYRLTLSFVTMIPWNVLGLTHPYSWNLDFPTIAERTAWRVFTLIGLGIGIAPGILDQWPLLTVWLGKKNLLLASMKSLGDPTQRRTEFEEFPPNFCLYIYLLARLGIFALVLSSLRALPVDTYTTPNWISEIPHL